MSKIFYSLNADTLTAEFWAESNPKEKITVNGRWQTYSGDRASKNNTRIIFNNLPAFCSPQVTITLNPEKPSGEFIPKLNTKTSTGATKTASIEYLQVAKFAEYLESEKDKKAFAELLEKAKQVFAKKQAEQHKISVNNHISGLEKLGLTKEALIELLQAQLKTTENEKKTTDKKPAGTGTDKKPAKKTATKKK